MSRSAAAGAVALEGATADGAALATTVGAGSGLAEVARCAPGAAAAAPPPGCALGVLGAADGVGVSTAPGLAAGAETGISVGVERGKDTAEALFGFAEPGAGADDAGAFDASMTFGAGVTFGLAAGAGARVATGASGLSALADFSGLSCNHFKTSCDISLGFAEVAKPPLSLAAASVPAALAPAGTAAPPATMGLTIVLPVFELVPGAGSLGPHPARAMTVAVPAAHTSGQPLFSRTRLAFAATMCFLLVEDAWLGRIGPPY